MKLRAMALASSILAIAVASTASAQTASPPQTDNGRNDDIIVTAPRDEAKARETQRDAPNVINVQSAEAIAKYPDFNAAEALSRVPGVSLSSDTGEGRFVNIRGIDGNLNGATYGGVVLLNTNPTGTVFGSGRAVEFDTIPTGAIDGFIVTKTGMPNHDAEGLGGTIELTPRSAANVEHPFIEGALGYGYEPEHNHGGPLNLDLAIGGRFGGVNKPFSFVITGSRRDDKRGFDDIEADYVDDPKLTAASGPALSPLQVNKALADIQLRRYDYNRRRFGYGGEFAYSPNDDSQYYVRASVAGYIESALKSRLTYDKLDGAVMVDPANPAGYATTTALSIKGTDEEETHRNQVYVIGGRNRFGNLAIDYHGALSVATFDVGRNYGTTYTGPKNVAFTYDNITNADFPALKVTDGTNVNDPTLYNLTKLSNSTEHARDREWSGAINATLSTSWIGSDDKLQFGGEVRLRNKTDQPYAQDFTLPATGLAVLGGAITDYYDNHYSNGPQVQKDAVRATAAASATDGLIADLTGYFQAEEDIYAGYAMYTLSTGKFGAMAGVRVEHTEATYTTYSFDGTSTDDNPPQVVRKANYTNLFPTVQLKYDFTPSMLLRATYSTGIGRPGFSQIASAISIDRDNDIITQGNPNLKPTTGNNFDLSFEKYLPNAGIISIGAFDKEFANYIVARTSPPNGTDSRLPDATDVSYVTFENVTGAYARGIEAAYDQRFAFLPKPFDGFGIGVNATYVDSGITLHESGRKQLLPATSKWTWNAAAYYESHGVQLRLSAQYVGSSLFAIGDDASLDDYQNARTTLDFTSSIDITKQIRLYFNVKNLTNEPLRIYEASSNRPIQREFYDQTYEGGVKFKF
jgi:TonB-dependent receptor